jgi:hypothetical protein
MGLKGNAKRSNSRKTPANIGQIGLTDPAQEIRQTGVLSNP